MQKICSVNEFRATFMFRPSFLAAPTHLVISRTRIHTALINSAPCCSGWPPPPHLCYPLVLPQHQKRASHSLLTPTRAAPR